MGYHHQIGKHFCVDNLQMYWIFESMPDNTAGVILAHSHPFEILKMSKADAMFTASVSVLAKDCNVRLLAHYIITQNWKYQNIWELNNGF